MTPRLPATCFVRGRKIGVWDAIFAAVSRAHDGDGNSTLLARPTSKVGSQEVLDANGSPIALKLAGSQPHDRKNAADVLASVGDRRPLLANRACDSDALQQIAASRRA
jgi:hypothetical protein